MPLQFLQSRILYCTCTRLQEGCPRHVFHNKLRGGFSDLDRKALTYTHVCNDQLIHPGRTLQSEKALQSGSKLPNNPLGVAIDS